MVNDDTLFSPPKYEQLRRHLLERIQAGEYPINQKLPSEDELAKRFGIARGTVRQALQRLEKQGVVESVHGVGTFVRRMTEFTSTKVISFIYTEAYHDPFTNEFYLPILSGAVREARKHHIKLLYTSFTPEEMVHDEELFFSHIGDGCIIMRHVPDMIIQKLHENQIPFVFIGNVSRKSAENSVIADNEKAARIATEYLVGLGHRRILHIAHDMSTVSGPTRLKGYTEVLKEHGIPLDPALTITCDKDREIINQELGRLFDSGLDFTAIFAASDHRAMLAMDYLKDRGIRVPQDLSIIGIDDLSLSAHPGYDLTTVHVDKEGMGQETIELMLKLFEDSSRKPEIITTDVRLIERGSCRAVG